MLKEYRELFFAGALTFILVLGVVVSINRVFEVSNVLKYPWEEKAKHERIAPAPIIEQQLRMAPVRKK